MKQIFVALFMGILRSIGTRLNLDTLYLTHFGIPYFSLCQILTIFFVIDVHQGVRILPLIHDTGLPEPGSVPGDLQVSKTRD